MSCYECKYGPSHCKRYQTDGSWPNPVLECFIGKENNFSYSWNEHAYHEFLESNDLWEKTMQDTLEEIKNIFEDDSTEVQSK